MTRIATITVAAAALVGATLVPISSAAAAAPPTGVVASVDAMFAAAAESNPTPPRPTASSPAEVTAAGTRGDLRAPVGLSVSPNPVAQFSPTSLTARTTPPAPGTTLAFQAYGYTRSSVWRTIGTAKANGSGMAGFRFTPSTAGTLPLRAVNTATGKTSKSVILTVTPVLHPTAVAVGWPSGTQEVDKSYKVPVQISPKGKIGVQIQRQLTGSGVSASAAGRWTNMYAGGGTTNANGVASLLLNIPDARPSNFRVVTTGPGAIGSIPRANTASAFGTALYNVPLQLPTTPGQLVKAQELTTGNAGPGFPLTYPKSPLAELSSFGLTMGQVGNAGNPACTVDTSPPAECTIGNQIDPSLQPAKQFRFLYSDRRMVPNDCPLAPGGSHGNCTVTANARTEAASAMVYVPSNAQPGAKVVAWAHPTLGQNNDCSVTRGVGRSKWTVQLSPTAPVAAGQTALTINGNVSGLTGTGAFASTVTGAGIAPGTTVASVKDQVVTLSTATTGTVSGPLTFSESALGGASYNLTDMEGFLDQMLAKGYVVVMPDYLGIAVNGPTSVQKTYMVGQQESRDLYYAVKALQTQAKPIVGWPGIPRPGNQFVTMGHSQGGSAAMWAGVDKKTLDPETGLNLVGVTAVAPAGDLNTITSFQWDKSEAWVLGPELLGTYASYLPQLAAQYPILSSAGRAMQSTLANVCISQASAVAPPNTAFLQNPAGSAFPSFLRWGYVFFGQTPVIEQGHINSFPLDLPLNLVAGQGDNTVLAQPLAALQQSFCKAGAKMTAYWTPVLAGWVPGFAAMLGFGSTVPAAANHTLVLGWPFGNNVGTAENPVPELSAGSLVSFAEGRFNGTPWVSDCAQYQQQMPQQTFYNPGTNMLPGTPPSIDSWYINTNINSYQPPLPFGLQDWLGSKGMPAPVGNNPAPAGGDLQANSGCLYSWGDPADFKQADPNTPTNPACTQFGLFPWGQYLYFTHDVEAGSWGIYPTNGTYHY
ncbi:MAG TPA: lipase family protein [Actinomycetota bacterium]|nr:lipase family protein [Actinomycetota bacterium]